jgi:hypothetical protein
VKRIASGLENKTEKATVPISNTLFIRSAGGALSVSSGFL